jgi:hypothetical protein
MSDELTPTPASFLKQAIKAVPAVRYALGVAGIIAVIAIVKGYGLGFRVAVFGAVIMLVLMTMLVVFARAVADRKSDFHLPALVFTWFALILTVATATALFFSVFWNHPLDFRKDQSPQPGSTINEKQKPEAPAASRTTSNPAVTNTPQRSGSDVKQANPASSDAPATVLDSWWVGKYSRYLSDSIGHEKTTFEIINDTKNLRAQISYGFSLPSDVSATNNPSSFSCYYAWIGTLSPTTNPPKLSYTADISHFSGHEQICDYWNRVHISGQISKSGDDITMSQSSFASMSRHQLLFRNSSH